MGSKLLPGRSSRGRLALVLLCVRDCACMVGWRLLRLGWSRSESRQCLVLCLSLVPKCVPVPVSKLVDWRDGLRQQVLTSPKTSDERVTASQLVMSTFEINCWAGHSRRSLAERSLFNSDSTFLLLGCLVHNALVKIGGRSE